MMALSFFRRFIRRKDRVESAEAARTEPVVADDDLAWLCPPCDVRDYAVWDRYWLAQATHGLTPLAFDMFSYGGPSIIECLNMRGAKTILCAGNGISQEPRALAAAGFEVVAMD